MSPRRAAVAALAPVPYTGYALARHQETICSNLRKHPWLFLAAWSWFAIHVVRKSS